MGSARTLWSTIVVVCACSFRVCLSGNSVHIHLHSDTVTDLNSSDIIREEGIYFLSKLFHKYGSGHAMDLKALEHILKDIGYIPDESDGNEHNEEHNHTDDEHLNHDRHNEHHDDNEHYDDNKEIEQDAHDEHHSHDRHHKNVHIEHEDDSKKDALDSHNHEEKHVNEEYERRPNRTANRLYNEGDTQNQTTSPGIPIADRSQIHFKKSEDANYTGGSDMHVKHKHDHAHDVHPENTNAHKDHDQEHEHRGHEHHDPNIADDHDDGHFAESSGEHREHHGHDDEHYHHSVKTGSEHKVHGHHTEHGSHNVKEAEVMSGEHHKNHEHHSGHEHNSHHDEDELNSQHEHTDHSVHSQEGNESIMEHDHHQHHPVHAHKHHKHVHEHDKHVHDNNPEKSNSHEEPSTATIETGLKSKDSQETRQGKEKKRTKGERKERKKKRKYQRKRQKPRKDDKRSGDRKKRNVIFHNHDPHTECMSVSQLLENFHVDEMKQLEPLDFLYLSPAIIYQMTNSSCRRAGDSQSGHNHKGKLVTSKIPAKVWGYSCLAVVIISLAGLLAVALVPVMTKILFKHLIQFLIAMAVGALTGDAMLHLLPHAIDGGHDSGGHDHGSHDSVWKGLSGLAAIYFFFILQRVMGILTGFRNKRKMKKRQKLKAEIFLEERTPTDCDEPGEEAEDEMLKDKDHDVEDSSGGHGHSHGPAPTSVSAIAWMIVLGDGIHNFSDGLAIGVGFGSSITGGISTAIAVLCHELPHEVGDFAVLLKSGMSVKQAVIYNCVSSVLCFTGMLIGVALGNMDEASSWIFAAVGGMFIYISLVTMMPELTSGTSSRPVRDLLLQIAGISVGSGIMLLIALFEEDLRTVLD